MTITIFLSKHNLLDSLKTLKNITDAGTPELVAPLAKFLKPLHISSNKIDVPNSIALNVDIIEYSLICSFMNKTV